MNKKVLSCLLALALILAFAFSVSADVIVPPDEGFTIDGSGSDVPWDEGETYVIETYDLTGDLEEMTPTAAQEPQERSLVKPILICAAIGLVIALIVVLAVKSSYKPVHRKRDAAQYLVDGSLRVTASSETFVRSEVSERTLENKNASGSNT